MALLAQRFEVWELVRLGAFCVVNTQVVLASASDTPEVVPHLCSEHGFRNLEWLVAVWVSAPSPYRLRVDILRWSSFPYWVVVKQGLFFENVWMGKAIHAFLRIAPAFQFLPCREPLIRLQAFRPLAYFGCPTRSVVDDAGFGRDQFVFSAPLVL